MKNAAEKNKKIKKIFLKKFERGPRPPKKQIVIGPRDMAILKDLADYRFLDARQIELLHPGKGGPRYNQRRLQYLYHHSYVDRPASQLSFYRTRRRIIYALGRKGADVIYEGKPELRGRINWQKKNSEVKFPFIDHAMMISDFRVALSLSLQKHSSVKLVAWKQGEDLRDRVALREGRVTVVPDAFFTLRDINKPEGKNSLYFFLEADRSNMDHGKFLQKLRAYWEWYQQGGPQKKLKVQAFRVLTVTISEERKNNLMDLSKKADSKGKGLRMFLFSNEKNYSFENPETILQSIWQWSREDKTRSILE